MKGEGEREAVWVGVWEYYLAFSFVMFSYGWLTWCMRILVRMAGYTAVPNWLETAATRAVCCTRDLPHSFTVQHTLSVAQFC